MKKFLCSKPFILTVLSLLLIGGAFYWFAYRPARIRHDCSWVRHVTSATPAEPAITKTDVEASQLEYDKCKKDPQPPKTGGYVPLHSNILNEYACVGLLKKERPAVPAKSESVWYQKATKEKYDFCIRENGLWR